MGHLLAQAGPAADVVDLASKVSVSVVPSESEREEER
jgi:hypothetical protein